jgi:hypothetical protein|tara:strand:+ start:4130 stop:4531 length:402 start_codon:yes stop_codon:yes gene_type:complete
VKRSAIVKKLDKIFSIWIRSKDADHTGQVDCYTCGVSKDWKYEIDAGHFQSRGKYATRWHDEDGESKNIKPQCKRCNGFRSGEQHLFALHLDEEYGKGTAADIMYLSNQQARFTNEELLEKIKHYTNLVKNLS